MHSRSRILRLPLALLLAAAAGPALAHAHLVRAMPAANASVTSPQELRLEFSEALELKFSTVKLLGPNRMPVSTGTPRLDPTNGALLVVPLSAPLAAGKYTVDWHAVSTDTHKTQGSYSFTVKP